MNTQHTHWLYLFENFVYVLIEDGPAGTANVLLVKAIATRNVHV